MPFTAALNSFPGNAVHSLCAFSISDTKQNTRPLLTPVSDLVFYALSHDSLGFALHGSFSPIFLLVKILQQPIRIYEIGSYHGEQNASYHVKEDKNLYQKMLSKVTLHFV